MTTNLPEGFIRLPHINDVVAIDFIAALQVKCRLSEHGPPSWSVNVETRGGRFKFQIPAKSEQDAGLLRDEIVRDMWRAKRPAKAERAEAST